MDIEVRAFENTDRVKLDTWYSDCDPGILGGIGIIAHRGDELLASGFLLPTYSTVVYLEFIRTSPDATPFSKAKAVRLVIESAVKWAQDHGYQHMFGFVSPDNKSILKEHKRQGAVILEQPLVQVVRGIP